MQTRLMQMHKWLLTVVTLCLGVLLTIVGPFFLITFAYLFHHMIFALLDDSPNALAYWQRTLVCGDFILQAITAIVCLLLARWLLNYMKPVPQKAVARRVRSSRNSVVEVKA